MPELEDGDIIPETDVSEMRVSSFDSIYEESINFIYKHKIFIFILAVGIAGLIYIYWNSRNSENDVKLDNSVIENGTDDLLDDLDLNLTNKINLEHMDESDNSTNSSTANKEKEKDIGGTNESLSSDINDTNDWEDNPEIRLISDNCWRKITYTFG